MSEPSEREKELTDALLVISYLANKCRAEIKDRLADDDQRYAFFVLGNIERCANDTLKGQP